MIFISGNPRASGSLVALAIGDAMGAPLEGSAQPSVWVTEMRPGGLHFRKKGQITDDTLQALAVMESLLFCRGFDRNDLLSRLLSGYDLRPEWYGPTSSAFFELVRSGTLPQQAAWLVHKRQRGSRSNGSVMRGFPLGIYYPSPDVYEISLACSHITHFDPVAAHCSAWLNVMVSDMCRGVSRSSAYRHARSLCTHDEVHAVLGNYENYPLDPSIDVVRCSHAALASFMHARTLEGAILSAINLGGDADTTGACCGALAGAYWGFYAVPERWSRELEEFEKIMHLSECLWYSAETSLKENAKVPFT